MDAATTHCVAKSGCASDLYHKVCHVSERCPCLCVCVYVSVSVCASLFFLCVCVTGGGKLGTTPLWHFMARFASRKQVGGWCAAYLPDCQFIRSQLVTPSVSLSR